jgi:hypothetical protein
MNSYLSYRLTCNKCRLVEHLLILAKNSGLPAKYITDYNSRLTVSFLQYDLSMYYTYNMCILIVYLSLLSLVLHTS